MKCNLFSNVLLNSVVSEMLESRRASRISRIDDSVLRSLNTSVDGEAGRCNETQDIRDINDILGPLPKVPDSTGNWSRRISTNSEIYEEIGDTHRYVEKKELSADFLDKKKILTTKMFTATSIESRRERPLHLAFMK